MHSYIIATESKSVKRDGKLTKVEKLSKASVKDAHHRSAEDIVALSYTPASDDSSNASGNASDNKCV